MSQVWVGEDPVMSALAEMEVLFQTEAGTVLNLTQSGPVLLLDNGFGGMECKMTTVLDFTLHRQSFGSGSAWIRINFAPGSRSSFFFLSPTVDPDPQFKMRIRIQLPKIEKQ